MYRCRGDFGRAASNYRRLTGVSPGRTLSRKATRDSGCAAVRFGVVLRRWSMQTDRAETRNRLASVQGRGIRGRVPRPAFFSVRHPRWGSPRNVAAIRQHAHNPLLTAAAPEPRPIWQVQFRRLGAADEEMSRATRWQADVVTATFSLRSWGRFGRSAGGVGWYRIGDPAPSGPPISRHRDRAIRGAAIPVPASQWCGPRRSESARHTLPIRRDRSPIDVARTLP